MSQRDASQSGQIVLISLLILTIATTIALSLIGRTTTDLTISTQIEESSRAFSAAEAGIEEALKSGTGTGGAQVLTPGTTYNVAVASVGGAAGVYQFAQKTTRGVTETLWLVSHNADGTLIETPTYTNATVDLCWSSETTTPAAAVTILFKRAGVYYAAKGGYDSDAARRAVNKFSSVTALSDGCNNTAMYRQLLTFSDFGINPASDTLLMLRVRPVYSDTQIAVNAPAVLPYQGNRFESTGSTATGVSRKVVVYQQYRSASSSIYNAAVYSQSALTH
ncbi:MAG: hypothetical protein UY16_C0015G0049 [Candidatus Gottesmanbacteria bacterium GW2011_GWA2_47_9]|uniref:Type 4 fimbrial biogenesis protein PilX N-terminal domain-containing protein n=1 Tax=Candidatus Gottesmanbacteria bacterium GW2011_GWA2_47_9 TaxID=1618445 RepID=A0A0G1U1S3_9BACT|nr:MAG: hypothetical protein UY16_C0015G0049 [Candidatus Gottesmanbacteria bacterium GW2011_GWA2_47_9]